MNQAELKKLYHNLNYIRDNTPWLTMHEDMIMEINLPGHQTPYYGIFFAEGGGPGMVIHKGAEGLALLEMINDRTQSCDELLVDFYYDAFQVHFVPYDEIDEEEHALKAQAKIRFSKKELCPSFIKTVPGYISHLPKDDELNILAGIVRQMRRGFEAVKADDQLLEGIGNGKLLCLNEVKDTIQVKTHLKKRPKTEWLPFPKIQMDELAISRCNKAISVKNGQWEMDLNPLMMTYDEEDEVGEPGSRAVLLTAIDRRNEQVILHEIIPTCGGITGIAKEILDILAEYGISKTVCCRPGLLSHIFSSVLKKPKVKMLQQGTLALTEEMMAMLNAEMDDYDDAEEDDYDDFDEEGADEEEQIIDMLLNLTDLEFEQLAAILPQKDRETIRAMRREHSKIESQYEKLRQEMRQQMEQGWEQVDLMSILEGDDALPF